MSYSPNLADLFRRSTTYVDKLPRGAKAAELPVEQPTTFEKALGITLPPALMLRVNRTVE